jgi:hypothetical protein
MTRFVKDQEILEFADPPFAKRQKFGALRISRMSVLKFTTCQANISCDVGPSFHGMSVQVDAGRRIVSESSFGVNGCRG